MGIVLAISGIILLFAYQNVYKSTVQKLQSNMYLAAETTKQTLMAMDGGNFTFDEKTDQALDKICDQYNMSYVYAVHMENDGTSMEYLALGIGSGTGRQREWE